MGARGVTIFALVVSVVQSAIIHSHGDGDGSKPLQAQQCEDACNDNGICLDGSCLCSPGYTGEACGVDSCDVLSKCNGNGVCKNSKCFCNPGSNGDDCSKEVECPGNCGGNGVCKYGKCFCDPGFQGADCSDIAKCEDDCNSHGVCNGGKCLCELGWAGETCGKLESLKKCPNDCGGEARGLCRAGVCYCNPGFKEADCSGAVGCPEVKDGSDTIVCNKHGECLYGRCFCHPGWTGDGCTEGKTCLRDCEGNGQCFDGACECKPGYKGEACGEAEKCPNDCSHRGFCYKQKCFCNTGFLGEDCSVSAEKLKEEERQKHCGEGCSGHGVCGYGMLSFETSEPLARCLCQPGFSGDYCEVAHSCQGQCSGHGECVNGKCICECGYDGEACDRAALATDVCPNDCFGHGDCVLGKCFCHPGRSGELCEEQTECPEGINGQTCNGIGECKWGRCFCLDGSDSYSCSPATPGVPLGPKVAPAKVMVGHQAIVEKPALTKGEKAAAKKAAAVDAVKDAKAAQVDAAKAVESAKGAEAKAAAELLATKAGKEVEAAEKGVEALEKAVEAAEKQIEGKTAEEGKKAEEGKSAEEGDSETAPANVEINRILKGESKLSVGADAAKMRFAGPAADEAPCEDDCSLNGVCKFGQCDCFPGWEGTSCADTVQCHLDCSGKGLCQFGRCFCNPGYGGDGCKDTLPDFDATNESVENARSLSAADADSNAGLRQQQSSDVTRSVTMMAAVVGSALAFLLGVVLGTLVMLYQQSRTRAQAMEFLSASPRDDIGLNTDLMGARSMARDDTPMAPPMPPMPPMPLRPPRIS